MAGYIISIIGGKGGVGKSQFAANLAFAMAAEDRQKVLLLDFDQRASGDQTLITGMKSKKNLKELSEFSGSIDPRSFQTFYAPLKNNVTTINMPNDPLLADQIDVEGLGKVLKAVPNIFPLTIIDVGGDLSPLALKALEYSTLIFLVVSPDVLAVNQSKRLFSNLVTMLFPKDMIQVVLNQMTKGHPVSPDVVGKQIGKPPFFVLPKDDASCTMALNKKMPVLLINRNSAFSKGMIECVRKIKQKNVLKILDKLNKPDTSKATQTDEKSQDASKGLTPWIDLKSRIHKSLVEEMDLKKTMDSEGDEKAKSILREQTKKLVVELLSKEDTKGIINSRDDMNKIVKEVIDEALGLGPLEDMLRDKSISEIMVNGPHMIYYEQDGKNKLSDIVFTNDRQVLNVIERIVAPIGRRIDEKTPYVDARLEDGSRVHAIIPPCAIDGCTITIRKFPENRLSYKDLIKFGSLTENMADFLRMAVEAHKNIVVSGGTGSGKTTLINMLGAFIPANERIITCEDSAELDLPQEHVVRLETRPPTLEGDGAIDIRCLVKQTLRMKPDRIIVGECRGGETLDMLQAMNTGHDGSLTTVHSNSPRDCISRLETLVNYAGIGLPQKAIREMIASAVHLVVQQSRLEDGSRRIMNITEISGMQGDVITLQDIFVFKQEGIDRSGKVTGKFQATGFIPKFVETMERKGYRIPRGIFSNDDNSPEKEPAKKVSKPGQKPSPPAKNPAPKPGSKKNKTG
ncbi:MAG: Flp pilus assembly complex ATPase component TadA [Bacteriovoracaceae bacterium]|nr:Flp pilus assembly complex ATPase component TadA [Bacteriovoracaceae bacterium]